MKKPNLKIEEFVANPSGISGKFIVACCLLVDGTKRCWLAADFNSYEDGRRIEFRDSKGIVESLYRTRPVLGGGPVVFNEKFIAELEVEKGHIINVLNWELESEEADSQ